MDIAQYATRLTAQAKTASRTLARVSSAKKDAALEKMAGGLLAQAPALKAANERDLQAAEEQGLAAALIDRLRLTDSRIESMAEGLREVVSLPDPVGQVMGGSTRPNGLRIQQVRVPIGVIVIIYESRPNVTADAAGLCLKAGNAAILRGGKEAIHSNLAIHRVLADALAAVEIDPHAIQIVETTDRQIVDRLVTDDEHVDVVIPRGGEGLIRAVVERATVPVIKHYKGVCHVYVDEFADLSMAEAIAVNAKVQRPGTCNAMETLLVHEGVAARFLPAVNAELREAGVEIRGCPKALDTIPEANAATEEDWETEYLDLICSVKVVSSLEEAVTHIERYGSAHSDAIVTENVSRANAFVARVDSAAVYVNASTRFTDGYEFGLGAEIGISTDKLHARGPMGLEELTSYKYVVHGSGQLRQ